MCTGGVTLIRSREVKIDGSYYYITITFLENQLQFHLELAT